ncbi:hypothetical protein DUNSADRAFT_6970 [Dunaliella salina]|uniref:Uncharacterized protein n=1 Tax=Dunaliella salina TaxID=3046 RepID=A0ABQ7GM58_DUNSA|nr:hypothetical protein DUNSADRAFT_6970 [Dunaliella salina]|eukprot:KAF5835691.1 hypothetical protein DUNSADRAFT_6970 [Dunaliella salina]
MLSQIVACRNEGAPALLGGRMIAACASPAAPAWQIRKKKEAKQNLDKDHAALEAASGIFGDKGGYVRHELELAEQAGVDDNIVCEQFARLFCGQHTSVDSPLP